MDSCIHLIQLKRTSNYLANSYLFFIIQKRNTHILKQSLMLIKKLGEKWKRNALSTLSNSFTTLNVIMQRYQTNQVPQARSGPQTGHTYQIQCTKKVQRRLTSWPSMLHTARALAPALCTTCSVCQINSVCHMQHVRLTPGPGPGPESAHANCNMWGQSRTCCMQHESPIQDQEPPPWARW